MRRTLNFNSNLEFFCLLIWQYSKFSFLRQSSIPDFSFSKHLSIIDTFVTRDYVWDRLFIDLRIQAFPIIFRVILSLCMLCGVKFTINFVFFAQSLILIINIQ